MIVRTAVGQAEVISLAIPVVVAVDHSTVVMLGSVGWLTDLKGVVVLMEAVDTVPVVVLLEAVGTVLVVVLLEAVGIVLVVVLLEAVGIVLVVVKLRGLGC